MAVASRGFQCLRTWCGLCRTGAITFVRALPPSAWLGVLLALAGVLVASAGAWLGLGLAVAGIALLVIAARKRSPHRADEPGSEPAERLAAHVEDLKDVDWELRESEARYRDLLDTQQSIIARRDGAGRLTYVNKAYCRTFSVSPEAVLGQPWQIQVLAEERADEPPGAPRRRYVQLVGTAQGERWYEFEEHRVPGHSLARDAPDATADGETQIVGIDITERKTDEVQLAAARDEAQAADRAKSRFLAAMSHEIRTPMNGIMGMASLLGETPLSPDQQTYLNAIDQSARTLLLLIDEILDFSKIEAGKLELSCELFTVADCVQGAVELLAPSAHEKGLEIAWTVDREEPLRVVGDPVRVRQIVLNLVGNAVKYTDRGGVLVSVTCEPGGDGRVGIAVRVKDTGVGLSEEAQRQVFAEFNQGDADVASRRGGTGLGLAISRRLARAMGGDITVTSEPGAGSEFSVNLTLPLAGDRPTRVREGVPAGSGRVLLAFDRLIERRALASNLTAIGFEVIEVGGLVSGSEIEAAAAQGRPIGFVVCDARANPAKAAAILEKARACAPGGTVRGIILTDQDTRASFEQFREAGFQSYLVQPIRPSTLRARFGLDEPVEGLLLSEGARTAPAAAPSDLHVLLAEDNSVNALLATRMLERSGCTVVHVPDGEAAVEAVLGSLEPGARPFDLVLMDIHMPKLDGLAAATAIKAHVLALQRVKDLPPIVALTANAFKEDRDRCLATGLDDYLAKPFHKSDLAALLERWGRGRPSDRAA